MPTCTDPRVLLAAERTLLAWNRTSISIMVLGFVIERFGLFVHLVSREEVKVLQREISFYVGIVCIWLAVGMSFFSLLQFRNVVMQLPRQNIPAGYNIWFVMIINGIVGLLGIVLAFYVYQRF